jgi:hypothetical protein
VGDGGEDGEAGRPRRRGESDRERLLMVIRSPTPPGDCQWGSLLVNIRMGASWSRQ